MDIQCVAALCSQASAPGRRLVLREVRGQRLRGGGPSVPDTAERRPSDAAGARGALTPVAPLPARPWPSRGWRRGRRGGTPGGRRRGSRGRVLTPPRLLGRPDHSSQCPGLGPPQPLLPRLGGRPLRPWCPARPQEGAETFLLWTQH